MKPGTRMLKRVEGETSWRDVVLVMLYRFVQAHLPGIPYPRTGDQYQYVEELRGSSHPVWGHKTHTTAYTW
jgi:hypothetical protein